MMISDHYASFFSAHTLVVEKVHVDAALAERDAEIAELVDVLTVLLADVEPDPLRTWVRGSSVSSARAVLAKYKER